MKNWGQQKQGRPNEYRRRWKKRLCQLWLRFRKQQILWFTGQQSLIYNSYYPFCFFATVVWHIFKKDKRAAIQNKVLWKHIDCNTPRKTYRKFDHFILDKVWDLKEKYLCIRVILVRFSRMPIYLHKIFWNTD